MVIIHNISAEASKTVEDICDTLTLTYTATISFVTEELHVIVSRDYEIDVDESRLVPFMIRFLHHINSIEYERIEIF